MNRNEGNKKLSVLVFRNFEEVKVQYHHTKDILNVLWSHIPNAKKEHRTTVNSNFEKSNKGKETVLLIVDGSRGDVVNFINILSDFTEYTVDEIREFMREFAEDLHNERLEYLIA